MKITRRQLRGLIKESMETNPALKQILSNEDLQYVAQGLELAEQTEEIPETKSIVYKPRSVDTSGPAHTHRIYDERIIVRFKSHEDGEIFKKWINSYMKSAEILTYDDVGKPYYEIASYMSSKKFIIKIASNDIVYRANHRYSFNIK